MRLFLLPINSRNTLIYAQRLNQQLSSKQGYLEKVSNKASERWVQWEAKESGWQKKVTVYGNQLFAKIPYQEWGLKSIPPLSSRKGQDELQGDGKIEVLFPGRTLPESKVPEILKTLATERQGFHKQRLVWTVIGMPFTLPFALIPVIPNLPFFYMAFRAWSHWKALEGSKHITHLLDDKLLRYSQSSILQKIYDVKEIPRDKIQSLKEFLAKQSNDEERTRISTAAVDAELKGKKLQDQNDPHALQVTEGTGHLVSLCFDLPAVDTELERAIKQVNSQIAKEKASTEAAPSESPIESKKQQ